MDLCIQGWIWLRNVAIWDSSFYTLDNEIIPATNGGVELDELRDLLEALEEELGEV